MTVREAIAHLLEARSLTEEETTAVMEEIMGGEATPAQIGAFLALLRRKGETVEEIAGAARVMRSRATQVTVRRDNVLDTCGTGGDAAETFNISTAAGVVAAAAGCTVAKHGNRAISGKVGGADVLELLGIPIETDPERTARTIEERGFGFLFAPRLHGAMKHAAGPRRELGVRTIFNLLGPLTNPAGAKHQLLGVFDAKWVEPLASVLGRLGSVHAMIVHGDDGLDEITLTTTTTAAELREGRVETLRIEPEMFGFRRCEPADLRVTDAAASAARIRDVLAGEEGPARDVVLLNAGVAIYVADLVATIPEGIERARRAIDEGRAKQLVRELAGEGTSPKILDDIVRTKREEIGRHRAERPVAELERGRLWREPRRGFRAALARPGRAIIAEVKKASPSRGVIRTDFDPVVLAKALEDAGARALSVLTDEPYFQGNLAHLEAIRENVELPLLRKDFVVDPYQITEARAFGADAVLLICACLDDGPLRELLTAAGEQGLDALVEVHTVGELEGALDAGARLIGINNRDLRTFETRLEVAEELATALPPAVVGVAESGLRTAADLERLERSGIRAFLIGESLMEAPEPEIRLREFLEGDVARSLRFSSQSDRPRTSTKREPK